jgi:hypothetical protein
MFSEQDKSLPALIFSLEWQKSLQVWGLESRVEIQLILMDFVAKKFSIRAALSAGTFFQKKGL